MDVGRIAPPRRLVSSSVGVFGVSAIWAWVGVMETRLRGCCSRWEFLCLWVSGCEDLGCPPCVGHEVLWGVVVAQPWPGVPVVVMVTQPLPGVPMGVMVTQPLPGVPVGVMVTQPLPGFPVVRHRRRRRPPACLLHHDRRDPRVSTVHPVVGAQGGRPLQLHPGLPGRPVLWEVGGYTG